MRRWWWLAGVSLGLASSDNTCSYLPANGGVWSERTDTLSRTAVPDLATCQALCDAQPDCVYWTMSALAVVF